MDYYIVYYQKSPFYQTIILLIKKINPHSISSFLRLDWFINNSLFYLQFNSDMLCLINKINNFSTIYKGG